MNEKHYLIDEPREVVAKLLQYPSELWSETYEVVAEDNDRYAADVMEEILGKGYNKWTKYDACSYTWWMNITPGQYKNVLDIDDYDYFSDDDAKEIKELQKKVKALSDKVETLEDCDDYYDKIGAWEDEADELADKIIQIVVNEVKRLEEVTDEQIVETFVECDLGDNYYYIGDDKSTVYRDYTKPYKTNYKEGE